MPADDHSSDQRRQKLPKRELAQQDFAERFAACEAAVCGCRPIVERAYRELVDRGRPDRHALEAATVVLRWHHPELAMPEAEQIVERWVAGNILH
ncbi:hypothetical protein [Azospirillum canadense]|uniref:hypothetical protein n=1 Tax=Azospirillum canadense TaxID=403962 RepID=UPI0022274E87|nr:hypothetical protein [Azospirillum canadense]MCW2243932.1 hypothetical protein [Azospirillum canadense]